MAFSGPAFAKGTTKTFSGALAGTGSEQTVSITGTGAGVSCWIWSAILTCEASGPASITLEETANGVALAQATTTSGETHREVYMIHSSGEALQVKLPAGVTTPKAHYHITVQFL